MTTYLVTVIHRHSGKVIDKRIANSSELEAVCIYFESEYRDKLTGDRPAYEMTVKLAPKLYSPEDWDMYRGSEGF